MGAELSGVGMNTYPSSAASLFAATARRRPTEAEVYASATPDELAMLWEAHLFAIDRELEMLREENDGDYREISHLRYGY